MRPLRKAWLERVGSRYAVIWEGVLFPGHQNRTSKTFARRSSALDLIHREGGVLQPGNCPLPRVTDEMREAYQNASRTADGRAMQRAVMLQIDPQSSILSKGGRAVAHAAEGILKGMA